MKTIAAKDIKTEDLIELDLGFMTQENLQWGLVLSIKENPEDVWGDEEEGKISFFVKVGQEMFWTVNFSAEEEFNAIPKDPSVKVDIHG